MVDFSLEAVHKFWSEHHDKHAYMAILKLEAREQWAMDSDEKIEQELMSLAKAFEQATSIAQECFDGIIKTAAHIRTGRYLLILREADQVEAGTAARILRYAEEKASNDNIYSLFLRRHLAFERYRILGRVFNQDRIDMMNDVSEEIGEAE